MSSSNRTKKVRRKRVAQQRRAARAKSDEASRTGQSLTQALAKGVRLPNVQTLDLQVRDTGPDRDYESEARRVVQKGRLDAGATRNKAEGPALLDTALVRKAECAGACANEAQKSGDAGTCADEIVVSVPFHDSGVLREPPLAVTRKAEPAPPPKPLDEAFSQFSRDAARWWAAEKARRENEKAKTAQASARKSPQARTRTVTLHLPARVFSSPTPSLARRQAMKAELRRAPKGSKVLKGEKCIVLPQRGPEELLAFALGPKR